MAMNRADKSPKPLKNQTPQAEYDKKATELEEELKELPEDKLPLIRQCIEEEIKKLRSGLKFYNEFLEVHHNDMTRYVARVAIPADQYPQFNFLGKLFGPGGNTLRKISNESCCKMYILGKGSTRNKEKEMELAKEGGGHAHFNGPLHVFLESTTATPEEAFNRFASALTEMRKYINPSNEDGILAEQLQELKTMKAPSNRGRGRGSPQPGRGGGSGPGGGGGGGGGVGPPPSHGPPPAPIPFGRGSQRMPAGRGGPAPQIQQQPPMPRMDKPCPPPPRPMGPPVREPYGHHHHHHHHQNPYPYEDQFNHEEEYRGQPNYGSNTYGNHTNYGPNNSEPNQEYGMNYGYENRPNFGRGNGAAGGMSGPGPGGLGPGGDYDAAGKFGGGGCRGKGMMRQHPYGRGMGAVMGAGNDQRLW